jgi:hypothetical protein
MLFRQRFWSGMADGTVTLAFRRWGRPQVKPGNRYRTPAGVIEVDALDEIEIGDISEADSRAAGFDDLAELRRELDRREGTLFRISFHHAGADPRIALREDDRLSEADVANVITRLARLDAASTHGPWTTATLGLIADHPARRAGDLAEMVGRERAPFKIDVRKLKNLGLTESLEIGYRVSPRGRVVLDRLLGDDPAAEDDAAG